MGDNSGPGRRKCFGVSLVDLGDVEGFDSPPINNQVYGLEFANGIYRRKDISTGTAESNLLDTSIGVEDKVYGFKFKNNAYNQEEIKPEKLEELSDVDFKDAEINVKYNLIKNNKGKWFLMKPINWVINLSVTPQNIFVGKQHRLKKIMNNGSALVSYVSNKRQSIFIQEKDNDYYLKRSEDIADNIPVFLQILDEFNEAKLKVSRNSTIVIELYLQNAPTEAITILPGVKINWNAAQANKNCVIFIRGTDQTPHVSLRDVTITLETPVKIDKIEIKNSLYLKRLLYINELLPIEYLQAWSKNYV